MIEWWFLKAYKPLTKTYHEESVDSYPMMKKFTSSVEKTEPTAEGLQQAFEFLQKHAEKGECLLQGPLSKKLVNEPRKGKHITDAPMQRLGLFVKFISEQRNAITAKGMAMILVGD